MSYIDSTYYTNTFKGASTDSTTLAALILRACDIIDVITAFAISGAGGIFSFSAGIQTQIQKAAAYQTEYFIQNGGLETANSGQGVASDSVSIGKFSIKQRVTDKQQRTDPRVCPMAISMLEPTGLLSRNVGVHGGEFMGYGGWPIW